METGPPVLPPDTDQGPRPSPPIESDFQEGGDIGTNRNCQEETVKREGTYVHLWLIHVAVWQRPTTIL